MSGNRGSSRMNRPTGRSARTLKDWRAKEDARPDQAVEPIDEEQSSRSRALDEDQQIPREVVAPPRESENETREKQAYQGRGQLWVGNLAPMAKEDDVRALFAGSKYEVVDIRSGENPSYYFVDLQTKKQANEAIQNLDGLIVYDLPVKIRHGGRSLPKSKKGASSAQGSPVPSSRGGYHGGALDKGERNDAVYQRDFYAENKHRLYVGGLPRTTTQLDVDRGVQELFKGYNVEGVDKLVIPPTSDPKNPEKRGWDDCYFFVKLATAEEAERAAEDLDGRQSWGVKVRVRKARQRPGRGRGRGNRGR